jgi:hypothetical protein
MTGGTTVQSHGVSSFGLFPTVSSFGVFPGVSSFGLFPIAPSGGGTTGASGFGLQQDRGTGTAGVNADDVANKVKNALKADIDAIKANQAIILEDLKQLRIKQGIPRLEMKTPLLQDTGTGSGSGRAPVAAPIVAATDRDLAELAEIQKRIAEKEAKRLAAKQAPTGTGVAVNR